MNAEARFWAKVDKTDDCWLWTSALNAYGYGQFSINRRPVGAHRYLYEQLVGAVPDGLELDHLCRVRRCVKPAHLEPVLHRENLLRGGSFSALNAAKTHCIRGHEFAPGNTRMRKARPGRICLVCSAQSNRETGRRRVVNRRQSLYEALPVIGERV